MSPDKDKKDTPEVKKSKVAPKAPAAKKTTAAKPKAVAAKKAAAPKAEAKVKAPAKPKAVAPKTSGKIKVTLRKSGIGYSQRQKDTIRGLGLRKLNSSKVLNDTPAIRGMVKKVEHLVSLETV